MLRLAFRSTPKRARGWCGSAHTFTHLVVLDALLVLKTFFARHAAEAGVIVVVALVPRPHRPLAGGDGFCARAAVHGVLVVVTRQATGISVGVFRILLLAQVHVADPATKVNQVPLLALGDRVGRVKDKLVAPGAPWHEKLGVAPAAVDVTLVPDDVITI